MPGTIQKGRRKCGNKNRGKDKEVPETVHTEKRKGVHESREEVGGGRPCTTEAEEWGGAEERRGRRREQGRKGGVDR